RGGSLQGGDELVTRLSLQTTTARTLLGLAHRGAELHQVIDRLFVLRESDEALVNFLPLLRRGGDAEALVRSARSEAARQGDLASVLRGEEVHQRGVLVYAQVSRVEHRHHGVAVEVLHL